MEFTHMNDDGYPRMVDVSDKGITKRRAVACGMIELPEAVLESIRDNSIKKGDVISVAWLAGIMGAKKTPDLIPMCHPIFLSGVEMDLKLVADGIYIEAITKTTGQTGVEMEALTAVSIAALTIYDMCKSLGFDMVIREIRLLEKTGGKSDMRRDKNPVYEKELFGTVVSLNKSVKKGTKKTPVDTIHCVEGLGIEGDAHMGPGKRQVSLLALSSIEKVEEALGKRLEHGSFAENITVDSKILYTLPLGTKLAIGSSIHEVSQIGKTCHTSCNIGKTVGECVMPKEGIFTAVIEEGDIQVGDTIYRLKEVANEGG